MDDARESRPSAKNPSSPTEDARDSLPPIMKPDRDATEEARVSLLLSCAKAPRPVSSSLAATSSSARASSPSGSSGTAATCASSSSIAIAPHSAWPCAMDDARESRPSAKKPSSPTEDARDSLPPIMKSVMPVSASSSSSSSS